MAVTASVQGTTLAALVNAASKADNVSLLLFGSFESWETTEVSDSSEQHRQLHETINITSIAELPRNFHDGRGDIDENELATVLHQGPDSMVGWCHGRRSSSLRPSLRERHVIQNLAASRNPSESHNAFVVLLFGDSALQPWHHVTTYQTYLVDNFDNQPQYRRSTLQVYGLQPHVKDSYRHPRHQSTQTKGQDALRRALDQHADEASPRTAATRALEVNVRNAVSQLADLIHAVQYTADTVM
eukprot:m.123674 g.123674  ORF g.123674 m.123674 type:complete len:243 (+) comp15684_c0_seq2:13-741(+)